MPNEVNMFGSASAIIDLEDCEGFSSGMTLHIRKYHLKAIDQPTHPCEDAVTSKSTSACIADYIESEIGCNPQIHGSKYSQGPSCTNKSQLLQLRDFANILSGSDDYDVYNMTGCLAPCKRDVYSIVPEPVKCSENTGQGLFLLYMRINDRSYEEREEYIIYDTDSFIADVGGYMGLLLGCSILSLFNEVETLIKSFVKKPLSCWKINDVAKK